MIFRYDCLRRQRNKCLLVTRKLYFPPPNVASFFGKRFSAVLESRFTRIESKTGKQSGTRIIDDFVADKDDVESYINNADAVWVKKEDRDKTYINNNRDRELEVRSGD